MWRDVLRVASLRTFDSNAPMMSMSPTTSITSVPCADISYFLNVLQRARKDDDNMCVLS